jgi:membrane-bound lytic murein transglycosylase B
MTLLQWAARRGVVLALAVGWLVGAGAQAASFEAWLDEFRAEARAAGISEATLAVALDGLEPIPRVVELDRRQPSARLTWQTYRERVVSEERVARGRELYAEHRELLQRVARDYGVPARFIVALWGVESTYGAFRGQFPVIGALATLAWEGRRATLFRRELLSALRILESGDISQDAMIGSWAGAMGQNQFLPSSYLDFAVDYDGDGRRDIWTSLPDIFASMANYLARAGWNPRYTWGREVEAPRALDNGVLGLEVRKPLPRWQQLGVRRADGRDLPPVGIDASLLRMDDGAGPAYLVYHNFRVLLAWNRSTYFALSVGELADLIGEG